MEELVIVLILTNALLSLVLCFSIYNSTEEVARWKRFAEHQYERQNDIFTWLTNNLSEYGDFGQGDEPNIITFRKK